VACCAQVRLAGALVVGALLAPASTVCAQRLEVTPFGGYLFGGDIFEIASGRALDNDGAAALGVVVNVPLQEGFQVEGLFSHQALNVFLPLRPFDAPVISRLTLDQWQAGGLQEFGGQRVRPFLTGTLGLSRYASDHDSEMRFSLGAGGGVKMFPVPHIGVRLDGRIFATFVDADARAVACSNGNCFLALRVNIAWQAQFVAGVLVAFP
jgi:hypothetical protein